jgi:hypothetical protein
MRYLIVFLLVVLFPCFAGAQTGYSGSMGGIGGGNGILAATGPSTGTAGSASTNFTVTLSGTTFNGSTTVTIADGSSGGTITPSVGSPGTSTVTVTPTNGATSFTFTYTAVIGDPVTLTITNAQGWTNPATLPYTGAVTYTASGPSTGTVGSPSTNFTVSMPASVHFTGTDTITIADGSQGGTFTPSVGSPGTSTVTVTPAANATSFTFTYNAASTGAKTLTFTNAQSWTNPSPLTYTASFVGAGDVVASSNAWYGLRAYNAAYAAATGNIGIFRRSSDSTTCTGIASAATGGLDLTTAYCPGTTTLPSFCGASAGNCFATRLYDQSGAHACTGSVACDVVQATTAGQPQLIFNCHNALPCLRFANGSFQFLVSATNLVTLAQPLTVSFVSNQTGSLSSINVVGAYGSSVQWGYSSTANDATFFAGSVAVATGAPQNTLHAMQIVVNASASITYIDGTQTTGLVAGTNVGTGNPPSVGANSGDALAFNGDFYENGGWPGAFTTPQQSSMNTNQHTYWGF